MLGTNFPQRGRSSTARQEDDTARQVGQVQIQHVVKKFESGGDDADVEVEKVTLVRLGSHDAATQWRDLLIDLMTENKGEHG